MLWDAHSIALFCLTRRSADYVKPEFLVQELSSQLRGATFDPKVTFQLKHVIKSEVPCTYAIGQTSKVSNHDVIVIIDNTPPDRIY